MNKDLLVYSLRNLKKRKMRSFLSTLSIFIGIMSIFAILSFGQGLGSYIDEIAESMGTDKVIVQPKSFAAPGQGGVQFDEKDVEFISKVRGVKEVVPMAFSVAKIEYKGKQDKYAYLVAHPTDERVELFVEGFGTEIMEGRQLEKGESSKLTLGYSYTLPDKVFKRAVELNDRIDVNGKTMDVVGFYDEVGNPEDDKNLYVSFDAYELLTGEEIEYAMVYAQAEPGEDSKELAERIENRFRRYRNQDEGNEDFTVQTFEDLISTFRSIIDGLNAVLFLIAFISVMVAAVNIMNTMYTAVLERTKEIGILKAIGAKNSSVLMVFVIESGLLGLIGGIAGILAGWGIASMGGAIAANAGYALLKPEFPVWLIIGCLIFSFLVGALSGLNPSVRASKLNPVDALRYE